MYQYMRRMFDRYARLSFTLEDLRLSVSANTDCTALASTAQRIASDCDDAIEQLWEAVMDEVDFDRKRWAYELINDYKTLMADAERMANTLSDMDGYFFATVNSAKALFPNWHA